MTCEFCQQQIGEALEPGSALDSTCEAHLAGCALCREFRARMVALDAQLTRQAAAVELPPDFKTALLSRLPTRAPRLSAEEIAVRRAALEQEHRAALAQIDLEFGVFWKAGIRQRPGGWPNLARLALGLRVVARAGGWILLALLVLVAVLTLPDSAKPMVGLSLGLTAVLMSLRHLHLWRVLRNRFAP